MSVPGWLLWGFVATVALTTLMAAGQAVRFTRMSIPFILGAMITPDRDRAMLVGFVLHLLIGWVISLIYLAAFHSWDAATWWA